MVSQTQPHATHWRGTESGILLDREEGKEALKAATYVTHIEYGMDSEVAESFLGSCDAKRFLPVFVCEWCDLSKDQQGQLYRVLLEKHNIMEWCDEIDAPKTHWSRKIDLLMERRQDKYRMENPTSPFVAGAW